VQGPTSFFRGLSPQEEEVLHEHLQVITEFLLTQVNWEKLEKSGSKGPYLEIWKSIYTWVQVKNKKKTTTAIQLWKNRRR
jgi:hypothetical protein